MDEIPSRRSDFWLAIRVWDVIVAERLIKAVRDLIMSKPQRSRTNAIRSQMADFVKHRPWIFWSLPHSSPNAYRYMLFPLHPLRSQGFLFASDFLQGSVGISPTSTRYSTSPSSSLHIRLHFPTIQWLITLIQQTTKTKLEKNQSPTFPQADLNHSNPHLRLFDTLQQQPNQQLHIYHPTLQRQLRFQTREKHHQYKNQLFHSPRQPFRRLLKPAQSPAPQDPHQESWVLPGPSVRYVRSQLIPLIFPLPSFSWPVRCTFCACMHDLFPFHLVHSSSCQRCLQLHPRPTYRY